jgi:hypothetical protein
MAGMRLNMEKLFDEFEIKERTRQFRISSEKEMFAFLRQFISLTETESTPYKRRPGAYPKKAHYINGKKVNRQTYGYVKRWLEKKARKR